MDFTIRENYYNDFLGQIIFPQFLSYWLSAWTETLPNSPLLCHSFFSCITAGSILSYSEQNKLLLIDCNIPMFTALFTWNRVSWVCLSGKEKNTAYCFKRLVFSSSTFDFQWISELLTLCTYSSAFSEIPVKSLVCAEAQQGNVFLTDLCRYGTSLQMPG